MRYDFRALRFGGRVALTEGILNNLTLDNHFAPTGRIQKRHVRAMVAGLRGQVDPVGANRQRSLISGTSKGSFISGNFVWRVVLALSRKRSNWSASQCPTVAVSKGFMGRVLFRRSITSQSLNNRSSDMPMTIW